MVRNRTIRAWCELPPADRSARGLQSPPTMRNLAAIRAGLGAFILCGSAQGAEPPYPADLAGLTALALERNPEIAAFEADATAARASTVAVGRPMDPVWMFGAQAIGAMPDSADPPMGMVGVEQMLSFPGVYQAKRDRAELDERWAAGERTRVAADVRDRLWQTAARLRAQAALETALDAQLAAAEAALSFGMARYGAGAGASAPAASGARGGEDGTAAAPPIVARPSAATGGMSGMGGMGSGAAGGSRPMAGMADAGGTPGMGAMPGGMSTSMGGEGLAALLRLQAEVARVQAERDALVARRIAEEARLALFVGEEAARVVAIDPARFLGAPAPQTDSPERALTATTLDIAAADLRAARAEALPTFMVATDVRIMPEGMVDGVDASLGVTIPIWGGSPARVEAAIAASVAASRRAELVDRTLADAIAGAQADEVAAVARATALTMVALPRARAAWDATIAAWGAGGSTTGDVVAAWQTEVAITRESADAELAAELARARLARLEGR